MFLEGVIRKIFWPEIFMELQNSASKRLLASVLAVLAGWLATAAQGADTFTPTGSLATGRLYHTLTLLTNGNVLVAGGAGTGGITPVAGAERYNTATGTWTPAGNNAT